MCVCVCVAKDLGNCRTDMVLLYSKASLRFIQGRVINIIILGKGTTTLPREIAHRKKLLPLYFFHIYILSKTKIKT